MKPRIAVAGNLSLDDTVTPRETRPSAPGGDALYSALGVRSWGGTPVLLTLVGDDYPGTYMDAMVAAGIDVSHVHATEGPTVHYRVTYTATGDRTFEWVGPEERLMLTSPVAADYATLSHLDWLHLAAMPIEAQQIGVAAGRLAGLSRSLDPHEEYVIGFEERLRDLVEGGAFLPSELEARLLFRDIGVRDPIDFAFVAAQRLDEWRPTVVAIKLGPLGSVVRTDGRSSLVPAIVTDVVDATGAGDAYCGAFIVGWVVTGDPILAAACGSVAAAEAIGRFGAFGDGRSPTPAERLDRLERVLESVGEPPDPAAIDRLRNHLGSPGMEVPR
jgi:ribokinase